MNRYVWCSRRRLLSNTRQFKSSTWETFENVIMHENGSGLATQMQKNVGGRVENL